MALLHYENLTEHRPDILMRKTFDGLQNFFKFLDTAKRYLESDKAVKKLAWELASRDQTEKSKEGVWVQLKEHEENSESFEASLKLFLDENNNEIYEASRSNWVNVGSAARECSQCKQRNGKPKLAYQSEAHAAEVAETVNQELSIYECPHNNGWHLTREIKDTVRFKANNKIQILDRDPEKEQLLLDREPNQELLVLRPDTYQIRCQIRAIQALQNSPTKNHQPLIRLFEAQNHAKWSDVYRKSFGRIVHFENPVSNWYVLTDESRPGTDEQRKWVNIALNTPDFAFLEGPPGSGKTTAICELIIQLAIRGKRVLLCASTHVAVDNVLERLMDENHNYRELILPIRIGDSSSISLKTKPWQFQQFINTERTRLLNHLRDTGNLSKSQQELSEQLKEGNETIQKMVLESANLVCGTTIGILQHPDIKSHGEQNPQFDLMIIDEASKTTFQEFLVPALLAKRWVLVGDPKQLSPYVDDEFTAVNIAPCLSESYKRNACVDTFQASRPNSNQRVRTIVCTDDKKMIEFYKNQAEFVGLSIGTEDTERHLLPFSEIVVASSEFLHKNPNNLPLDIDQIRHPETVPSSIKRKSLAFRRMSNSFHTKLAPACWEQEVAWRLARLYEQRLNTDISTEKTTSNKQSAGEKLGLQIKELLPFEDKKNKSAVWEQIDRVRRVALPSVLESLQSGFERDTRQRDGTALSDGLPKNVLEQRKVTLSWQHRMHPDIAAFSHKHIYQEQALHTPDFLEAKRQWSYRSNRQRSVWKDVIGKKNAFGANEREVDEMMKELKLFDDWARTNPNIDSTTARVKPWEVVLLSFYRGQEKKLRNALRKWTGNHYGMRHFHRGSKATPYINIQVCTVDRFQGHEADFVLLSFSNPYPTSFLESPNRLNVAITRARYQLIVFGNRNAMKKSSGVLGQFANYSAWDKSIGSKSYMEDN